MNNHTIKTIEELNKADQEKVIRLILQCQRYQQGELDNQLIEESQFEKDWRDYFTRALKDKHTEQFICVEHSEPIAYIRVRLNKDPEKNGAFIDDLYVLAEYRSKGIATLLIEKAEDWAKSSGTKQLHVAVARANPTAQEVYKKFGFKQKPSEYLDYIKDVQ